MENSAGLSSLLSPVPVGKFFEEYWNRRAIHIPGEPSKFSGLFDRAAFDRAAETTPVLKVGYTDENGWPGEKSIRPHDIPGMLASGKTVCAGGVNGENPALTEFLKIFSAQFASMGKYYFNSYLSPDGAGFGLHLDDHPVWILQIEGSKRWWFSAEPGMTSVFKTVSFPRDMKVLTLPWGTIERPDEAAFIETVLEPGDVLYMPKGTWHRAAGLGSSLALTLAELCATPVDLLQFTLGPRLSNVEFRDPLPAYWMQTVQSGIPADFEDRMSDILTSLKAMVGSLTPADLYEVWRKSQVIEAPSR